MYYESYKKKKKRRRRGGCLGAIVRFFLKILTIVLVLAALAGAALYYAPTSLFMIEPDTDLALTGGLPTSPLNVLVLGVDVKKEGLQRSDAMLVASIDRDALRLTSIQRDMLAEIDGHGTNRINAAYAFGGPELAMRTVNEALDLNIMHYVVVDYTVVVKLVDAVGGIDMSISEAEMEQINLNVWDSRKVFQPLGYTAEKFTEYGENVHLDGLQALGYSRIRKLDSDFMRTSRQRAVINATLSRLREQMWNPAVVVNFLQQAMSGVETNLSKAELIALGEKALFSGKIDQLRLPVNGSFDDNGSSLKVTDRERNIQEFRSFVYGG